MSAALMKRPFLWRTMEGEVLTLAEMETKHIFNSMKMVFNHLAEEFGADPVWFVHTYRDYQHRANHDPDALAYQVLTFIAEIEARGDLPEKYRVPYLLITEQVFGPMKFKRIAPQRKEIV